MGIDIQPQWRELGRLKFGVEDDDRPRAIDTWRLTSLRVDLLEAASSLYGGTPVEHIRGRWELITQTPILDVILPPQDVAAGQWWELWTAGGLQRRCDGTNQVQFSEASLTFEPVGPCACDPASRDCKPMTVLRVILPTLPDVGVWRLSTRSVAAASELPAAAEALYTFAGPLPHAVLGIETRRIKRPGKPPHVFNVPTLGTRDTIANLASTTPGTLPSGHVSSNALGVGELSGPGSPEADRNARQGPAPDDTTDELAAEWDRICALLERRTPDSIPGSNSTALIADLVELERLLIRVGVWHPDPSGAGLSPIDLIASRGDPTEVVLWRGNELGTANLHTLAGRTLIDAHTRVNIHPAYRHRHREQEHP